MKTPSELPRAVASAEGPPWFMAFVLFDGDSIRFGEFMRQRITVLDEAWGRALHGLRIGNPNESGRLYERLRVPRRARRDRDTSWRYPRLVAQRGSEQHHILRETQALAEALGVPRRSLPALAFRTNPPAPNPTLLHVDRAWLASPETEAALSQALQEFLSEDWVTRIVESGDRSPGELSLRLQGILDELANKMRRVLAVKDQVGSAPRAGAPTANGRRRLTLVVDTRSHSTHYGGREVQLAPLPFRLNHILAMEARQGPGWVSRDTIESQLWQEKIEKGDPPAANRLDDVMKHLRAAYRRLKGVGRKEVKDLLRRKRKTGVRLNLTAAQIRVV